MQRDAFPEEQHIPSDSSGHFELESTRDNGIFKTEIKRKQSCQMKLLKRQFLKTQNEAQNDRCACSYHKCSSIRRGSLSHEKSVGNFPFFPETQKARSALAV